MKFFKLRKSTGNFPDPAWQGLEAWEKRLRDEWGLALDGDGAGYRKRLERICNFVRELEPDDTSAPARENDFDRYARVFTERSRSAEARESHIQRLEDLRGALEPLAAAAREKVEDYLPALVNWSPIQNLPAVAGESPGDYAARQKRVEKVLRGLGLDALPPNQTLLGFLETWGNILTALEALVPPPPRV